MTEKLNIGVLFGGRSGEHAVSLMSARFILSVLDETKYNVIQIGITREGVWMLGENALDALIEENIDGLSYCTLLPDPTRQGLQLMSSSEESETMQHYADIDVFFPALHGTYGEDGSIQGLFELADIAYVGAGVVGCATAMDKAIFSDLMRANDIPVVDAVLILRSEIMNDMDAAVMKAEEVSDYPLFTKPANLGSSVGISKAHDRSDLVATLMDAAQYDRRVVVQKGLNAREIEVSVIGNDEPVASVCGEIVPAAEFYSYEAKYHDERSESFVPADIPEEISEKIRDLAIKAYKACDSAGLARVDFFLEKETNEIYLNELNTMPGFTKISMYPKLWEASGLSNEALVDQLIELAMERKADRDALTHQYRRSS